MTEKKLYIIDVRTPGEFNRGHVDKALNLDIYAPTFLGEIQKLDKNQKYQLYCRTGNRSGQAQTIMKQLGFSDVENVGGLDEAAQRYTFIEEDK